jgi:hypothetical protein
MKNPRHQILPTPSRILHRTQSRSMNPGIPPRPHRSQPLHLPPFKRLIDPLNRHRHLLLTGKLIHPNNNRLLSIHSPLILISSILNLPLHIPTLNRPQHAVLPALVA